jgi:hypothetical protein
MIKQIEKVKGIVQGFLKDEAQIEVWMFDEEDELVDILESKFKEILAKRVACSYCATKPAIIPTCQFHHTNIGNFMFAFPSCDDHQIGNSNVADICRFDWAATFMEEWGKCNGLKLIGGGNGRFQVYSRGETF